MKEIEDEKIQKKRDEKRRKLDPESPSASTSSPSAMAVDQQDETSGSSTTTATSEQGKVNWDDYLDPELLKDEGCNPTGQYELCAVLTHVGRSADSGHYIGWVKKGEGKEQRKDEKSDHKTHFLTPVLLDEWHKFDDDKVSIVRDADIEKLDGGGDWHTAYIVLYRAKQLD
jgi:ubiquitin carboxyl-terminal hydrolase 14